MNDPRVYLSDNGDEALKRAVSGPHFGILELLIQESRIPLPSEALFVIIKFH
jgi:hypothetical protein